MMKKSGQANLNESESTSSEEDESQKSDDLNDEDDDREEEEVTRLLDYRREIMKGSFMPAMVMLEMKQIKVEDPIDTNQGLRILHYACYFGKIKAIKTLCEEYQADVMGIDYRG